MKTHWRGWVGAWLAGAAMIAAAPLASRESEGVSLPRPVDASRTVRQPSPGGSGASDPADRKAAPTGAGPSEPDERAASETRPEAGSLGQSDPEPREIPALDEDFGTDVSGKLRQIP